MVKPRGKHSREFKIEAVKQVVEQDRTIAAVASGLGINPNSAAAHDRNPSERPASMRQTSARLSKPLSLPTVDAVLNRGS